MSILYQALKRREQIETKPDGAFRNAARVNGSFGQAGNGGWLRTVVALAIVCAGGYIGYTTYLVPTETPELSAPTTLAVPAAQPNAAVPVTLAAPVEEPKENATHLNPTELKSIADVAAMLPDTVQQPLPTANQAVLVDGSSSPIALAKRAMALQTRGANDAAIMLYDEANAAGGADNFSNRVNKWGLIAATDAPKAVGALRGLVAERPRDAAARAQLGFALVKLGQTTEARIELEKAAALASTTTPESAQVWYNLGVMYDNSNERDAAIIAYEKAINGAITNNQQDVIDLSGLQRRLNYLRATPVAPTKQAEDTPAADPKAVTADSLMPDTSHTNVP